MLLKNFFQDKKLQTPTHKEWKYTVVSHELYIETT